MRRGAKRQRTNGETNCFWCNTQLDRSTGNRPNSWTLDRLDNSKAHTQTNCVVACFHCNSTMRVNRVLDQQKLDRLAASLQSADDHDSLIDTILEVVDFSEVRAMKAGNNIRAVFSTAFRFIDVKTYLPPGTSLASFMTAFNASETKGFLPYEYLDTEPGRLAETEFPTIDKWNSTLRGPMKAADYQTARQRWDYLQTKLDRPVTLLDYLIDYNLLDCRPFAEAISNMLDYYHDSSRIDLMKNFVSISQFAFWDAMQYAPNQFQLLPRADYRLMRANVQGGYSGVFHRYHEAGVTRIKGGELCKTVKGYDAGSQYMGCMAQDMPVGVCRHLPAEGSNIQQLLVPQHTALDRPRKLAGGVLLRDCRRRCDAS